jgi:hypothetical protein
MSGAEPASAAVLWAWGRATVAGNIGSFGCELTAGVEAMLNEPGVFSRLLISGTGASSTLRRRWRGAEAEALILRCGRAGSEFAAHSTMFGNCGSIFGGARGALG